VKIVVVTDAWEPQVNGVVQTLRTMGAGLRAIGHIVDFITPAEFTTLPCPTYPEIRLALLPYRRVARRLSEAAPDAIHIATEGPLGAAARRYCLRHGLAFTTAYHTRFPEYVHARIRLPLAISYAWLRGFHAPGRAMMVPTAAIRGALQKHGFHHTVLWSRGVDLEKFAPGERNFLDARRPVFLYVGRVAVEKNIEAFLRLDLPGSKWVVGDGPMRGQLERSYPAVRFFGMKKLPELAAYDRAADVMVFPSLTDTFGLVLLEALACGTPVAAYPVAGPIDVITSDKVGALDQDLRAACLRALELSRAEARAFAEQYSWARSIQQFESYLVPCNDGTAAKVRWPRRAPAIDRAD
jgi:glycosyltransferase involved in cell wall biosynthesis